MEKKCIVWGAGDYGRRLVPMLNSEEYTIIAFCDENAGLEGKKAAGYEIVSIKKAAEMCRSDKELAIMIGIFDFEAVEEVKKTIQDKFGENIEIKTGHDVQDIYENRILQMYHQNIIFKWEVDLEKYFLMWLDNLKSEIEYWVSDVADFRGKRHAYYIMCRENDRFTHRDIRKRVKDKEIVMDIGCGLVSKFGDQLDDAGAVKLVPVDALAHFYNIVNGRIQDGYKKDYICSFGLFEFLGNTFCRNYADNIIVENALDHCIDPWRSLIECLYVLKTGGRMYLNHRRAEAVYENWFGLHKWNMDCRNGDFLIWNKENAINVTENLKDYAEIYVRYDDSVYEREYQNVEVEMIKKKDFELSDFFDLHNDHIILTKFIDKLMESLALNSKVFWDMLENSKLIDDEILGTK